MRRVEGHVVDRPLVFKRVFLGDGRRAMKRDLERIGYRLEPRERRDLERAETSGDQILSPKEIFRTKKETMNAGGVEELKTTS
ncbi:hypothetical protein TNCV_5012581 [Trichonephila clavipes]|nr:hypothetical protein TNCV_5012581 [Trichonephila clavipes]